MSRFFGDDCETCPLYGTKRENTTGLFQKECFRPECQLLKRTRTLEEHYEHITRPPITSKEFCGWSKSSYQGGYYHFFIKDRNREKHDPFIFKSICGAHEKSNEDYIFYLPSTRRKKKTIIIDPNSKEVKDKCARCVKMIEYHKLYL